MTEQKKSRMTLHRETNLEADERKLVDDIEKYGCHVVHVKPQQPIPGWTYTIGLYETLQQPELIVVGMKQDLAKAEQRWAQHVMGYALWFYGEDEFPVFQCVYPDLNNRFPWDDGFDTTWRDRQALLFQDVIPSAVERDFWAANDPSSSMFDWTYNLAAATSASSKIIGCSDFSPMAILLRHTSLITNLVSKFSGPSLRETRFPSL